MQFVLSCIAPFNHKIKQGVKGRSETFGILKNSLSTEDKTLWFHCASLGEYEQGLPVFKALKAKYTNHISSFDFFFAFGI